MDPAPIKTPMFREEGGWGLSLQWINWFRLVATPQVQERAYLNVQAPAASLTDFAPFRTRQKAKVTHVTVHCASLPSAATTWQLNVMKATATIASYVVSAFSVVGNLSAVITLVSSNTLVSVGESITLEMKTTEKGKFDVIYQYQVLNEQR